MTGITTRLVYMTLSRLMAARGLPGLPVYAPQRHGGLSAALAQHMRDMKELLREENQSAGMVSTWSIAAPVTSVASLRWA